jgi:hypothetical protein
MATTYNRNWSQDDIDQLIHLGKMQEEQSPIRNAAAQKLFEIPELKQFFSGFNYYDYPAVTRAAKGVVETPLGKPFAGDLNAFISANKRYTDLCAAKQRLAKKNKNVSASFTPAAQKPTDCLEEAKAVAFNKSLNIDQIQLTMDRLLDMSKKFDQQKADKEAELARITGQLKKEIDKFELASCIIGEKREWFRGQLQIAKTQIETEKKIEAWESANSLDDIKIIVKQGVEPVEAVEPVSEIVAESVPEPAE